MGDPRTTTARRVVDIVGAIAVVVGVLGFVFKPSLAIVWAFLLLFGITTVPERAFRALRERRRREQLGRPRR